MRNPRTRLWSTRAIGALLVVAGLFVTTTKIYATATTYLSSNSTAAALSSSGLISSLLSTGFTLGTSALVNSNGDNYVAWNWKEDSAAGLDIVTYTGTGANRTVSHNLGSTPAFIIVKRTSGANSWVVYHQSTGNTGEMTLNTSAAFLTDSTAWNNTSPTSANFTVGTGAGVNTNGESYIAYVFAEKPGFSKFGSYTGNGSTDGPFVHTGFKPRYLFIKRTTGVGEWKQDDTARQTIGNPYATELSPNQSAAEYSGQNKDLLANGFKLRASNLEYNNSGDTYIYAAFAEYPFERATTNNGTSLANSTRLNGTNAYLSRTPATSGSLTTWTYSVWVKRSAITSGNHPLLSAGNGSCNSEILGIDAIGSGDDIADWTDSIGCSLNGRLYSSQEKLRDPSKWVHLVYVWDTTNAVAADRMRIYIDGVRDTTQTSVTTPALNQTSYINQNTLTKIGSTDAYTAFFNGYLSDAYFIDGSALTPTSFAASDSNGNWSPITYSGSYGTNGFHLAFGTAAAPGTDTSGQGNDFTNNNIATTDNVADTPTNNFATLNSILPSNYGTPSNGGLVGNGTALSFRSTNSFPSTGKWYWEATVTSGGTNTGYLLCGPNALYRGDGTRWNGSSWVAYGATYTTGDVVACAADATNNAVTWYKNGGSQGAITSNVGLALDNTSDIPGNDAVGTWNITWNFGQGGQSGLTFDSASGGYFKYTPPSGFKALSSANMISAGVSAIAKPSSYFNAVTYTGTGAAQSISTVGFQPDLLWIKDRTSAQNHVLFGDGTNALSTVLTITSNVVVTGNVGVLGTLSKGSGTFVIDHPLDPKNKLLYHSLVESPDVKNVYDGVATLNDSGEATIELPEYFMALNQDFRYLGTAIGKPMPELHLKMEIRKKWFGLVATPIFKIAGGVPNGRVSWQVTGNRKDPFIFAYPIITQVPKTADTPIKAGECLVPALCK